MRDNISDLTSWPLRKNGQPIFKSTNEAFLYAQLIYNQNGKKDLLHKARQLTLKDLKYIRKGENPNLTRMMDLAVRAQFFRECLEECKRIEEEKLNNGQVQKPQ